MYMIVWCYQPSPDSQEDRLGGDPEATHGLWVHDREDQAPDESWLVGDDGAACLPIEVHHTSSGSCLPDLDVHRRG
jgi:hypothetical protein